MTRLAQNEFLSDKGGSVQHLVPGDYVAEVVFRPIHAATTHESTGQIFHIRVPGDLQIEEAPESVRKKSRPPKRGRLRDRN